MPLRPFISAMLACIAFNAASVAQRAPWERLDGPYGGTITASVAVLSDGSVLAGTRGGVFLSRDGERWEDISRGLVVLDVRALLVLPDETILAGTFGDGVFVRSPGDSAWRRSGLSQVFTTALLRTAGGVLVAAAADRLYWTTGLDEEWTDITPGTTALDIQALAATPSHLFAGTNSGVWRTPLSHKAWLRLPDGMGDNFRVTALTVTGNGEVVAGVSPLGPAADVLYRLPVNGTLWQSIPLSPNPTQVRSLAIDPAGQVLAGGYQAIHACNAALDACRPLAAFADPRLVTAIASGGGRLYAGTYGRGVMRSSNGGTSWMEVNHGIHSTVHELHMAPDGALYVGTEGGVYRSSDRGANWTILNDGLGSFAVRALQFDERGLLVAGTVNGLFLLDPVTLRWSRHGPISKPAWAEPAIHDLALAPDGVMYASYYAGVYRRAAASDVWAPIFGLPEPILMISVAADDTGILYAGGSYSAFRHHVSAGTWTPLALEPIGTGVQAFALRDGEVWAGTRFSGIFRSRDHGESWTREVGGLFGTEDVRSLVFEAGGTLFAGTFGAGVLRFRAEESAWQAVNYGLSDQRVVALAFDAEGFGYAGTHGGGLWRLPSGAAVDAEPSPPVSGHSVRLYPNPFGDQAALRANLPAPAQVSVEVFDVLGRRVATSAKAVPSGPHDFRVDVAGLAPGLYVFRVAARTPGGILHMQTSGVRAR
jgi:photosystem II stability/assembly factor-like uncharacterized protein